MPDFLFHLQKVALLAFLVGSMLAMGLKLTLQAIFEPLRSVRFVILALGLNFGLAPLFAWLLTVVFPLERGYCIGLIMLGCVAGAPFLPKLIEVARGDAALAAALVVLLTLGTILFLPYALPLITGQRSTLWTIASPLLLLIVLPLVIGMVVNNRAGSFAARVAPVCKKIGNVSLLVCFVLLISLNVRLVAGVIGSGAILVALIYFTGLFAIGWFLGGSKDEVRGPLALACTGRNFGAALIPASSIGDPRVAVMIVVGAIVCTIVACVAAGWIRARR